MQTAFFVPTKHLKLTDPAISTRLFLKNERLFIELGAHSLARLVECSLAGADVVFSDNYFDLPAAKTVTISADLPAGWSLTRAQAALRVRSIYDTF